MISNADSQELQKGSVHVFLVAFKNWHSPYTFSQGNEYFTAILAVYRK